MFSSKSEPEALWASVDQDLVKAAVTAEPVADYDVADVMDCIRGAVLRWLKRDLQNFHLEQDSLEHLIQNEQFKGYLDIFAKVVLEPPHFSNLGGTNYSGSPLILDWKTSKRELDKVWRDRQLYSWQWKLYSWQAKMPRGLFIYRGVRRPHKVDSMPEYREMIIDVGYTAPNLEEETTRYLAGARAAIDAYKQFDIWPQVMPKSCFAFNRECPYFEDCDRGLGPKGLPEDRPLSFSRIETLWACPEKYRRQVYELDNDLEPEDDSTEGTRFGNAFHRGIAEVYRQAWDLPGEEK